jgi:hypothetical protein
VLHLGAGDARRDDDQNGDENRSNGQAAKPDGPRQLTGSLRLVHWQLTSVNCASFMNNYSSSAGSARVPRWFEGQGPRQDEVVSDSRGLQIPPWDGAIECEADPAESAKIDVMWLG